MVAKEIRRDYEYKDAQLSEVKVTGKVVIKDNKLYKTLGDIIVEYPNGGTFSFNLHQENIAPHGMQDELLGAFTSLVKNSTGVKEGMNDNAIVEEFKAFLKKDLGLTE